MFGFNYPLSLKSSPRICLLISQCHRIINQKHMSSESQRENKNEFEVFGRKTKRRINPAETSALLFPGQGSHYVGMARELIHYPNVKEMFKCASEILGYNLLNLCISGSRSELDKTVHCQPAVVVTSLAAVEKLQVESPEVLENCFMAAGYSAGEYAALVFAGALAFEDCIKLVKVRAEEMQKASDATASGMVSIVGGAKTKINMACSESVEYCNDSLGMDKAVCKVSGYLAPNVRTVAGHRAALEFIYCRRKEYHMKRVHILPVSGAFHSSLMMSACEKLKSLLSNVDIQSPSIKVYSNIDGKPYHGSNDIMNKLPHQIVKPVHWEQTMHHIFSVEAEESTPNVFELCPGTQLGSLLKKCNGKAWAKYLSVDSIKSKTI